MFAQMLSKILHHSINLSWSYFATSRQVDANVFKNSRRAVTRKSVSLHILRTVLRNMVLLHKLSIVDKMIARLTRQHVQAKIKSLSGRGQIMSRSFNNDMTCLSSTRLSLLRLMELQTTEVLSFSFCNVYTVSFILVDTTGSFFSSDLTWASHGALNESVLFAKLNSLVMNWTVFFFFSCQEKVLSILWSVA